MEPSGTVKRKETLRETPLGSSGQCMDCTKRGQSPWENIAARWAAGGAWLRRRANVLACCAGSTRRAGKLRTPKSRQGRNRWYRRAWFQKPPGRSSGSSAADSRRTDGRREEAATSAPRSASSVNNISDRGRPSAARIMPPVRRTAQRATHVSEKDLRVVLCRLDTAILAASCGDKRRGGVNGVGAARSPSHEPRCPSFGR